MTQATTFPRTVQCRDLPGTPPLRAPAWSVYQLMFVPDGAGIRLNIPSVPLGRDECQAEDPALEDWVTRHARGARFDWSATWVFASPVDAAACVEMLLPYATARSRRGQDSNPAAVINASSPKEAEAAARELLKETEAVLARIPGDPVSHFERGDAYRRLGHADDALRELRLACAGPSVAVRAAGEGAWLALSALADPGAVHAWLDGAFAAAGPLPSLWRARGEALLRQERREEAAEAFGKAGEPLRQGRLLKELGHLEEAEQVFGAILLKEKDSAGLGVLALDERAHVLATLGRLPEALDHVERLLKHSHTYPGFLLRGKLHAQLGNAEKARVDLEYCVRYSPEHAEAAKLLLAQLPAVVTT